MKTIFDQLINSINSTIDPNVDGWLLMGSGRPIIIIVSIYLFFVMKLGPKMMESREAFKLNNIIILYNGVQVLFSFWLMYVVSLFDYCSKISINYYLI